MTSLWPFGLTGRVVVIVVGSILVLVVGGMALHLHDRATSVRTQIATSAADRVSAVTLLLDRTPAPERGQLLDVLGSRWMRLRVSATRPAAPAGAPTTKSEKFAALLRENLQNMDGRAFDVFIAPQGWREFRPLRRRSRPDGERRRRPFVVASVALSDGNWISFGFPVRTARLRWEMRLMVVIGVSVLAILLIAVWAAHRVTRPVSQLAKAADRLGTDVRAAPLPDRGSREIRMAARAFNRMQERLRRMIDDRTFMLAAISHDLRTVLTRLKLRAEYIEDERQRERAVADIDEMQAMLETSLAFARDDTTEEPRRDVDLSALLQSLCDDMTDAGEKASFEGAPGLICNCEQISMRRALGNLIGNAIKYGDEAVVLASRNDSELVIEIMDRGPGIAESLHERVFMPFFRVEPSRNRETGGTGLGLSVARNVFRRHGGDITLHDRPGGGLCVRAVLPV